MWPFVPSNVIHWLFLFRFDMFLFNGTIQPINRRTKIPEEEKKQMNEFVSIDFIFRSMTLIGLNWA